MTDADGPYRPIFQRGPDDATYDRIDTAPPRVMQFEGKRFIAVPNDTLSDLAAEAFSRIAHQLRPSHLQQLSDILADSEASTNDRYVARSLLSNAIVSAAGVLPMCQDTG